MARTRVLLEVTTKWLNRFLEPSPADVVKSAFAGRSIWVAAADVRRPQ